MDSFDRAASRRQFLRRGVAATAGVVGLPALLAAAKEEDLPPLPDLDRRATAPTAPVSIGRGTDFHVKAQAELLSNLFEQALSDSGGGLGKIVQGKTVTIKLNTTGNGRQKMRGRPAERSYQVHPNQVEALVGLIAGAGARRIVLVESFYETKKPEEILGAQGWNIARIHRAGDHKTSFEDTRNRGAYDDYAKVDVPWGGFVFPSYHLNRRYVDTDVLVSIAKVKEHITAGVTGAVKNLFGIAPTSLYGNDAPNEETTQNRGDILHHGTKRTPDGVTSEIHADRTPLAQPLESYFRVPAVTADLVGARPIDLSIVEGIETCKGGEGPWCPRSRPVAPGIVLAGANAVNVDSIMTAVMGFDPTASTREKPWYGYNHLELLARAGVGTNDPARIDVRGVSIEDALFRFQPGVKGWVDREKKTS